MERTATCSCGMLKAHCLGEPASVSLCHCRACQRRTGAPVGVAAFCRRESIEVEGPFRDFARSSDSGFRIVFHFCGLCGSTVFWEPSRKPDMIAVGLGSFADPGFPGPGDEYHAEHRHDWIAPLVPKTP